MWSESAHNSWGLGEEVSRVKWGHKGISGSWLLSSFV